MHAVSMDRLLVGRAAEQDALGRLLGAARSGQVPIALVAGEAGVGKTTLVESVLTATDRRVLRGRASEWTRSAYEVLAQSLRPAVSGMTAAMAGGGALALILPELGAPPPEVSLPALASAVASVLAAAAGSSPVAVFLDDLQWADEATLDLLPALAGAVTGVPAVLIGCYRADELPRDHRLRPVRAELRRNHRLEEINVAPLGDDDVYLMLSGLLGAKPEVSLAAAVTSRADGIPFAVEELAFALRDGGRLAFRAGMAGLTGPAGTPVPDGVREAVLLRTTRLGPAERSLIEAAAVAGNEFEIDTVLAVAGGRGASAAAGPAADPVAGPAVDPVAGPATDPDAGLAAADPAAGPAAAVWPDRLAASGLVTEVTDGHAAFRHALTRDAAYADIPWTRRRELHRALASRLAKGGCSPALIAAHLLAARDFAAARGALLAAAEQHCAVHAYRDAARALRTALEHWPSGAEQGRRLELVDRLARCTEMCADYADAVALLLELADGYRHGGDKPALAAAQRRLALAHEMLGQWDAALASREAAAVAFAAAGLPAEAAIDRLAAAAHLRSAASFSAALGTLTAARADAEAAGRVDLMLRAEGLRGNLLSRMGQSREGVAALRAALGQALTQGLTGPAAELHQRLADALEHAGDNRAASAAYASAYQFCAAHGDQATGQLCRACVTVVLFSRGLWDHTSEVCGEVLESAASLPHARAVGSGILGLVHAMRGAATLARPELLEAASIATRIELTPVELLSSWGLCVLDDAAGARGDAARRARLILRRWSETQERHYCVPIMQWAATFFAEIDAAAETRACAAALCRIAEETAQPEAVAAMAHAVGEAALLDGELQLAAQELLRAVELLRPLDLPLATAQAQRRAALVLTGLGAGERAAALLHEAHDTAQRLGADPLRGRCAAALAALGERPRRRGARRETPGLSRREIEVMRLVAQGNTSREIGGCLFLSHRTVEMYVRSSMRKLECKTRAEAVHRLAELGGLDGTPPHDP